MKDFWGTTSATAPSTGANRVRHDVATVLDLVRERARDGEEGRRIPDDVVDALREAGAFRLSTPRRFGGEELSVRETFEITGQVSQADMSTGWVTTLVNVCNWIVGTMNQRAQDDVWSENPDAMVCGVLAPLGKITRVDGGYLVSGEWAFGSGSQHADWAFLGVNVTDDAGEVTDHGAALIPLSELGYRETWFVAGLQGTGSNTILAEEVFVPDHRMMSVAQAMQGQTDSEHQDEALYRAPFAAIMSVVLDAPLVGVARGALDLVLASQAKGKGISYAFYERAADAPSNQIKIAQAAAKIDTAEMHMWRSADMLDRHIAAGTEPSMLERAQVRMDLGYIADTAREAVDLLLSVQGASGFAAASPLQRMWRDLNTASRHAVVAPGIATEVYGRALLGIEEPVSPMV